MGMSINDCRDPDKYLAQARYLTKDQLEALKEFEREKAAQGTASGTRYMYFFCLYKLARFLKKPFKKATRSWWQDERHAPEPSYSSAQCKYLYILLSKMITK